MAINFPNNRNEIVDRIKTDVQTATPETQPFLPKSWIGSICVGFGGRVFDLWSQLKILVANLFVQTSDGVSLERQGSLVGINKNAATQSDGPVVITGTLGTILAAGTTYQAANSNQYTTDTAVEMIAVVKSISNLVANGSTAIATTPSAHLLASGQQVTIAGAAQSEYNGTFTITATSDTQFQYGITGSPASPATGTITAGFTGNNVNLQSVGFGAATKQPSGSVLTILIPVAGIDSIARVTFAEISGGADVEEQEPYRGRVEFRYQNIHALFNLNQIITTAKSVAGVTRVWPYKITPVIGDTTVYFVRDNDINIIPDSNEVTEVYDALLAILPGNMNDDQLHVDAPDPVTVDFVFSALMPNTPTIQAAIEANLDFYFRDQNNVGIAIPQAAYESVIIRTTDSTGVPVQSFTLSSPAGDVAVAAGQIAVLGTVTFP